MRKSLRERRMVKSDILLKHFQSAYYVGSDLAKLRTRMYSTA